MKLHVKNRYFIIFVSLLSLLAGYFYDYKPVLRDGFTYTRFHVVLSEAVIQFGIVKMHDKNEIENIESMLSILILDDVGTLQKLFTEQTHYLSSDMKFEICRVMKLVYRNINNKNKYTNKNNELYVRLKDFISLCYPLEISEYMGDV